MSRKPVLLVLAVLSLVLPPAADGATPTPPATAKRAVTPAVVPTKGFSGKKPVPNASIDLDCGNGRKITISTGSGTGTCYSTFLNGKQVAVSCNDGPNQAEAVCGGCTGTSGAATCTVR